MKTIPLFLLVLLLGCVAFGYSSSLFAESQGGKVQAVSATSGGYSKTELEFRSYDSIASEIDTKAKLNLWDKAKTAAEKKWIPKGGLLMLSIERLSIEAANLKYFSVVAVQNGKTLFREDGKESIPEVPHGDGLWWNLGGFDVPKKMTSPFTVYVVDNLHDKRYEFLVTPDSTTREIVK
ncbi:MAG: hypothetical protein V1495_03395 [Pseudomonadota bacterium]